MKRLLFMSIIFFLNWNTSFAQKEVQIKQILISYWGDSIVPQNYELNLNSKKIYFRNPFINYLDIKGGKFRYRVRKNRKKINHIFSYVETLNFKKYKECANFEELKKGQKSYSKQGRMCYTLEVLYSNDDYFSCPYTSENVPKEIKDLYELIAKK